MNYNEAIEYLMKNCQGPVAPGLERMMIMTQYFNHPQRKVAMIHVAGTNGKGSTTAMITEILSVCGYSVGRFTSPHLVDYTERIYTNDLGNISQKDFAHIMTRIVNEAVPLVLRQGLGHPSQFELLTMLAFLYYAQMNADLAVMEVGLGGRLDSTNIISPVLSVITPVSLDHCSILGNTVADIAYEKAGIIKSRTPVVVAQQSEEALAVIQQVALTNGSPLILVNPEKLIIGQSNGQVQDFELITKQNHYASLSLSLQGEHQIANGLTAVYACEQLMQKGWEKISYEGISQGLAQTKWPGRMEYISLGQNKGILLDGAHNEAGISALAQTLDQVYSQRKITFVLGILDDKDQDSMLPILMPRAAKIYVTKPAQKRAENWSDLAGIAKTINPAVTVLVRDSYQIAIDEAIDQLEEQGLVCLTGSLYLLGAGRQYLMQRLERMEEVGHVTTKS